MALVTNQERSHLTFGIIADIQYADYDNGPDFSKTKTRYYRSSLNLARNAVEKWKSMEDSVAFIIQLGDLIDIHSTFRNGSEKAFLMVMEILNSLQSPIFHVIGNHDLYCFSRSFLTKSLLNNVFNSNIEPENNRLYYTILPHPKLRIVSVDAYELSILGYDDLANDDNFRIGQQLLQQNNPNKDWNDTSGLEGLNKRWAAYNGGVSQKQLKWISETLQAAQENEENVIIISKY